MPEIARNAIVLVIVLVGGLLAAAFYQEQRYAPELAEAAQRSEDLQRKIDRLTEGNDLAGEQLKNTEREVDALNAYIASLEESNQTEGPLDAAVTFEPEEALEETTVATENPEERRSRWEGRRGSQDPEEMERRREAGRRMVDRVNGVLEDQRLQASTVGSQERLDALAEYRDYQSELRERMRESQTDEERDLVRQDLRVAREEAQILVQQEQNERFKQYAKSLGVKGEQNQARAVQSLREVMQEPIFSMESAFTGGISFGRGGPGGRGGDVFRGGPRPTRAP